MTWFNEPIRIDRNNNGGGILLFVREGILTKFCQLKVSYEETFSQNIVALILILV